MAKKDTAKKAKKEKVEAAVGSVASGKGVHVPIVKRPVPNGTGVGSLPKFHRPKRSSHRAGGAPFEAFCRKQGINPQDKRSDEEWSELLDEFARRPVHGHRRQSGGGTHKRG